MAPSFIYLWHLIGVVAIYGFFGFSLSICSLYMTSLHSRGVYVVGHLT